jgi:Arylsulfotransferase (ASST)
VRTRLGRLSLVATKVIVPVALGLVLLTGLTSLIWSRIVEQKPFPGYTLVAPIYSTKTHLIDMDGRPVRTWDSNYTAGQAAYVLENGHLLRAGQLLREERLFNGPLAGGRVQEFTWDGALVWDFKLHNDKQLAHHDVAKLPNGNVLLIVWELKSALATIAAGRSRELVEGPWLVDSVIEIKPTGKETGEIAWEWHVWDHLIAGHDSPEAHRALVAAHPELIDIEFGQTLLAEVSRPRESPESEVKRKSQLNTLRSIGYLGTPAASGNPSVLPDWTHVNAVAFNADLDQIMLTVRAFSEFWIIDHSTTTAEAKGHTGGRSGMGGDLLYRWGNPQAYRAGAKQDQQLFAPHGAHWIPRGCPGEGNVLVFNNGIGRTEADFSSADEIVLPVAPRGRYLRGPSAAYGPEKAIWSYAAPDKTGFFARLLSSAQRLPNGNTLICNGETGEIFEVTPAKKTVWQYRSASIVNSVPAAPIHAPVKQGNTPRAHELLSLPQRETLKTSPQQNKFLDDLQTEVDVALDKALTERQKKRLIEMSGHGSGGYGGFAAPGQIMSLSRQILLKPTEEQKKVLAGLQKHVDDQLATILAGDQAALFEKLKSDFARGGPLTSGRGTVPGAAFDRPGGVAGDFAAPHPPGVNPVFRATRYGADYAGLAGKDLRAPK